MSSGKYINGMEAFFPPQLNSSMIHSGPCLVYKPENAIGAYGDTALTPAAVFGVFNDHMLVKPDVHFTEYVVFAFVDTIPASFTLAGI